MDGRLRFGVPVLIIVLGLAGGLFLNASIGGHSTGVRSSADPCFGNGSLEATIVVKSESTPGATGVLNDCHRLGHRVVLNAETGAPVTEDLLDQEVADYYREHPDQNPRIIAEQTADAEFSVNSFTAANPPTPIAKTPHECPVESTRTSYPEADESLKVSAAVCVPTGWKIYSIPGDTHIGSPDNLAQLGLFPKSVTGTAGTLCGKSDLVTLVTGVVKICAFNPDPWGGQGHGFVLPSGREGGINLLKGVSDLDRGLVFQMAYSTRDE